MLEGYMAEGWSETSPLTAVSLWEVGSMGESCVKRTLEALFAGRREASTGLELEGQLEVTGQQ